MIGSTADAAPDIVLHTRRHLLVFESKSNGRRPNNELGEARSKPDTDRAVSDAEDLC